MYEFLQGTIVKALPPKLILEVAGVGYGIWMSNRSFEQISTPGHKLCVYTALIIREDAHTLYGFLSPEEKQFFELLLSVSGVGPKTALALLGFLAVHDLETAIIEGQSALLAKAPGMGKKTAEKVIVELKDKMLDKLRLSGSLNQETLLPSSDIMKDAISALHNLGYHPTKAYQAVKKAMDKMKEKEVEVSVVIREALKTL